MPGKKEREIKKKNTLGDVRLSVKSLLLLVTSVTSKGGCSANWPKWIRLQELSIVSSLPKFQRPIKTGRLLGLQTTSLAQFAEDAPYTSRERADNQIKLIWADRVA